MSRYTVCTENLHLFPLDLFWKQFETYLPARRPIIYSQSRWVGGFGEVRHHRRAPLSPPHLRNAELMGISQREATFQSTRPRHTCRAPGVSCLHHASLDTGTGIDTSSISKSQRLSISQQYRESISDWARNFLVSGIHIYHSIMAFGIPRYAFKIQPPLINI